MRISPSVRILAVASDLFFREGIRTVGVDRIISEADIAKATFYRHFPSKEDLVLAYLADRHDRVMAGLHDVRARFDAPRDQIDVIFTRLHEKAENPEFRGCAFALAVAEHGESDRIVTMARFHKQAVADVLLEIAQAARIPDAAQFGAHLALLYDGALARRAVTGSADPMLSARACALAAFDMAVKTNPSMVN